MRKRLWILPVIGALAMAALVVIAVFALRQVAAGWLLAFTYIAGFPLGSLALLLIHRLTGGRWGEALEPFFRPLALTTPLLLLFVVPVLIASPILFPWQHGADGDVTHTVRLIYLNLPSYATRSLIALAGWSVLAYILPGPKSRAAPLIAGVGLVFYGIAINFIGLDWVLAAEPVFFSTSFGAERCLQPASFGPRTRRSCRTARLRPSRPWRVDARGDIGPHLHRLHGRAGDVVRRRAV